MGSNGSHLTVRDNTFWNNSGYEVGSIALKNSSAFIDHNTFVSNHGNQVRASLLRVLLEQSGVYFSPRTYRLTLLMWGLLTGRVHCALVYCTELAVDLRIG